MTIEERNTARAIQDIAKEMKKPKHIDWEARRYEIAKDMMAALISNPLALSSDIKALQEQGITDLEESIAKIGEVNAHEAVAFADALIEELKKK